MGRWEGGEASEGGMEGWREGGKEGGREGGKEGRREGGKASEGGKDTTFHGGISHRLRLFATARLVRHSQGWAHHLQMIRNNVIQ